MTRRLLSTACLIVCALLSWPATPSGQIFPTLSRDLALHPAGHRGHRVIVQADGAALLRLRGSHPRGFRELPAGGGAVFDVTDAELDQLQRDLSLLHISGDLPVHAGMAVTNKVTAAETVWQGTKGLLGLFATPGDTGKGVGVAILDSGIALHTALDSRVIAHVNLVSTEPAVSGDPFGHGTHLAGIVGGNTTAAKVVTAAYSGGSAPAVSLIDVRVLGSDGVGLTSDVIAGIDWAIANRARYNIRVINLSLGHPVTEPSTTDPLCQAVARAVTAGIVVVTSAGNYGTSASGAPVLGGITSPGNSPLAITVGATDTFGTLTTSDDRVAPYSSRGPTPFEMAVKPDVVAPGTKLVSLEVPGSYLTRAFPQWHIAGTGKNAYMRLSGTSMAAAVVSGGVALLLNAQPSMSPAQVKIALQMGARYMPDGGLIGSGAGCVNFGETLTIANGVLVSSLLNTVTSVLGLSSGAAFRDRGTLIDRAYDRTGLRLLRLLDLGGLLGSAEDGEWGVLNLLGLTNPLASMPPNRLVWGQVAGWSSSYYVIWGSAIQSPSGQYVIWGSSDYSDPNYVIWGSAWTGDTH
jgi:serine protease AprX